MIEVSFQNSQDFPVDQKGIENTIAKVFLIRNVTIAHVGVMIVDETEMTRLNQNFKHHQGATDVLSFVMHDPEQPTPGFLETDQTQAEYGDIVLCFPVIAQEAADAGVSVQEQLEFLTEHACLHLLGEHHE